MDSQEACRTCQSCGHHSHPSRPQAVGSSVPLSQAQPTSPRAKSCRRIWLFLGLGLFTLVVITEYSTGSYLTSTVSKRTKMKPLRQLQWTGTGVHPGSFDQRGGEANFSSQPLCPLKPPGLVGQIPVADTGPEWPELRQKFPAVQLGGRWRPSDCVSRERLALVVPYRDREENLRAFLNHMHPFLQKQQLDYGVYVVEQGGTAPFNRGLLLNIGFHHSLQIYNYTCFAFHDVDMVPEMDNNLYRCNEQPIHLSVAQDRFKWGLPYPKYFGGAGLFSRAQYISMNGYPNRYFGWGGEDDDLFERLKGAGYQMARYAPEVGRYRNFNKGHFRAPQNNKRYQMVNMASAKMDKDGLNTMKYQLLAIRAKPLFTWIHVDVKVEDTRQIS